MVDELRQVGHIELFYSVLISSGMRMLPVSATGMSPVAGCSKLFGPLNNLNPRLYDRPSVAILHDIQEQYFPEYFSRSDLLARQEIYPEICRSATTVVAISQFCKQTFVEKFGIDPDKVEVVPNAPQAELLSAAGDGSDGSGGHRGQGAESAP